MAEGLAELSLPGGPVKMKKYYFIIFIILLFLPLAAKGAILYLEPSMGEYYQGDVFLAEIGLDTEGEEINVVEANLNFPKDILEVVDLEKSNSILSLWIGEPTYFNTEGLISFVGGLPSPGYKGKDGLIGKIIFRVKKEGEARITFQDTSRVFLNDGQGMTASLGFAEAVYDFSVKPEGFLVIESFTHPDQSKWYSNNQVELNWQQEEAEIDYSYTLDRDILTIPDDLSEGSNTSIIYTNLENGIWYFHIKAKENNIWKEAFHFKIQIDTESPLPFQISVNHSELAFEGEYFITFTAVDEVSGIDYYEVKEGKGDYVRAQSPYVLTNQKSGKRQVQVKALDKAGNFREETLSFSIPIKKKLIYILITIAGLVGLIILIIIWLRKKRRHEK